MHICASVYYFKRVCVETAGDFLLNILLNDPLFYMKNLSLPVRTFFYYQKRPVTAFYSTQLSVR